MKAPYVKKLTEVGEFTIFIVDGSWIRKNAEKDFTNFAQHFRFPKTIPMYEFWIDEAQSEKEETYFRDHMLKEWELMKKGVSYDKAFAAGDKVENRLRHRGKSAKHCKPRPAHEYDVGAKLLRKEGQINIWLVKGDVVRDRYDTDFTEGGHDLVYTYIPSPNNVWIDDMMVVKEREPTIIHETTERAAMAKGEKYHPAHQLALEAEWKWRHAKH